jgi:hypothetical protein
LIWKQNDLSPCLYNSIFSVLARTSIRPDPMGVPLAKPEYGILEYPAAVKRRRLAELDSRRSPIRSAPCRLPSSPQSQKLTSAEECPIAPALGVWSLRDAGNHFFSATVVVLVLVDSIFRYDTCGMDLC